MPEVKIILEHFPKYVACLLFTMSTWIAAYLFIYLYYDRIDVKFSNNDFEVRLEIEDNLINFYTENLKTMKASDRLQRDVARQERELARMRKYSEDESKKLDNELEQAKQRLRILINEVDN